MIHDYRMLLRKALTVLALMVVPLAPGLLAFPLIAAPHPVQAAMSEAKVQSSPCVSPIALTLPGPPDNPSANEPNEAPGNDGQMRVLAPPKPGELWVAVSIAEQRVRVYRGRQLIKDMIASTGTTQEPTPLGTFHLQNRGYWFYSPKYDQGGYYWVSFKDWGVYLFHSVPTDKKGALIPEEAERLGEPVSHGCIRLGLDDARWFFENIPAGTRVEIF